MLGTESPVSLVWPTRISSADGCDPARGECCDWEKSDMNKNDQSMVAIAREMAFRMHRKDEEPGRYRRLIDTNDQ